MAKNKLNKKAAVSGETLWYIPRLIFLIIMVIVIVMIINMFVFTTVEINDAQSKILFYRMLYSDSGIAYYDSDIGRTYPGIVDPEKIDSTRLDSSLQLSPNYIAAAEITLKDDSGNVIKTGFFNKEWFDRWYPVALTNMKGSGGVDKFEFDTDVLLRTEKDPVNAPYKKGTLHTVIVIPK